MLHVPRGLQTILLNIIFYIISFLVYPGLIYRSNTVTGYIFALLEIWRRRFTAGTIEPTVSADFEQLSPHGRNDNFQNNSYLKLICSFRGKCFLFKKKHICCKTSEDQTNVLMNRVILTWKIKITPLSPVHVHVVTVPGKRQQPLEGSTT